MIWENFSKDEFACQHCGENDIKDEFVDVLQALRSECGFPFRVTSGYRCPEHPIEAAKTSSGTHTLGLAADIGVSHKQAFRVLQAALAHPQVTGIGVNQKGGSRFIHIDIAPEAEGRPREHIWSY